MEVDVMACWMTISSTMGGFSLPFLACKNVPDEPAISVGFLPLGG